MANRTVLVCSTAVALALYFIYAFATSLFLQHLQFSSIDLLESVIVITQVVRIAGIVAYYGTKPARIEVLLVLLSFETFIVMGLIIMYLVSPNVAYSNLAHSIFSTWIATLFTVLPSYLIFAGVAQMVQGKSLITVLISLSLEFGFLTFAASTMLTYSGTFSFSSYFDFLIGAAKVDLTNGVVPGLSTLAILIPSVAVYSALLVYSTIPTANSVVIPKVTYSLPLLAATIALVWVYVAVEILPNTLLSFTVPGVALAVLLWLYMRR